MRSNAKAVAHLKEGDVSTCILLLKKELAMARSSFAQSDMHEDEEGGDAATNQEGVSFTSISIAPSPDEPPVWEDCHQNPSNLFSFYPCAFVFNEEGSNSPIPDARHMVVLLYNLALANHVEAAKNGWSKLSLDSARNLYETALELADASWDALHHDELRCVLLAALNNMGFISSLRMDFLETRHCLGMMCELVDLEVQRPVDNSATTNNIMPEEDFELFLYTVFTFMDSGMEQSLCVAPAA